MKKAVLGELALLWFSKLFIAADKPNFLEASRIPRVTKLYFESKKHPPTGGTQTPPCFLIKKSST